LKHILVPLTIFIILGAMVLSVPPLMMDFLIVSNLIFALLLLVSSLYISEPLKLSSLPTLLLLATLYRLSLNIASTRLVLGSGDAGRVIEAFGHVVIQGNIVVGLVVFLVITLVQFIVIAKGAERVAEVSARFTLDAMPGKQMSIDADVRAGLIDFETARTKRQELQIESRFYGALDGAMKFVKGDAIAGIVIIAVNLLGGFIIGVTMEGLDMASAMSKYSLLSIGDGLVSQIPALLNAMAAGMIITRVTRGDGASLATELVAQLNQMKLVRVLIGLAGIVVSLFPGIPMLPFLTLSIILILSALVSRPEETAQTDLQDGKRFKPSLPPLMLVKVTQRIGGMLYKLKSFSDSVESFRQDVFNEHGIFVPRPEFELLQREGDVVQISIRGLVCVEFQSERVEEQVVDKILTELSRIIRARPTEFIDDVSTKRTLTHFEGEFPELISSVVPTVVSVTQLTGILRALASEGISVRCFDLILQAIAECGPRCPGGERGMLQEIRCALRRVISNQYVDPSNGTVSAITIEPVIDIAFAKSEREGLVIAEECLESVAVQVSEIQRTIGAKLIIASKSARRIIRDTLELRGIVIQAMALEELAPGVKLQSVGVVEVEDRRRDNLVEALAA
jgi:type III secretion protein V